MEVFGWTTTHWSEIIQSLGILGGLIFTALSFRNETRARRVTNRLAITAGHRDLWSRLYSERELHRILEAKVDLNITPVTNDEELFILLLVLHLGSVIEAIENGMYSAPAKLREDIVDFFSLPIPRSVWDRIKVYQDPRLVGFVDAVSGGPKAA